MMSHGNEKYAQAEERIINERRCTSTQLREERAHNSRQSARLQHKLAATINKVNNKHESSINLLRLNYNKKYEKARSDVVTISTKLKEQHLIWQKRLKDMDSLSKNLLKE